MNLSALDFTGLMNAGLMLVTAIVIFVATAVGRRTKKMASEPFQSPLMAIEGAAIVSSESITMLTKEVVANTVALALQHQDAEKQRALHHQMVEALRSSNQEANDLRQAVQNLTIEFVRAR